MDIDILRSMHELEVFKIELEMQSLELQESKDGLALALEKHDQLYDFAPMGYVTVNALGDILEMNLQGARLLGIERSRLLNRRLLLVMAPICRPIFLAFLEKVFARSNDYICEILLLKQDGGKFWADFRTVSATHLKTNRKWRLFTFRDITDRKLAAQLTARELEVLRLIVAGKPNKQIAAELSISQRTVEKHRVNLMGKLKIHDIAGLTRYAISTGIIEVVQG